MDVYQRRRLAALGGLAAVIVVIAVMIGTCGGDEETPVPVTTIGGATGPGLASLPKQDFIDQADSICAETDAALEEIGGANAARTARQEAETVAAELNQLQTLPPSEEDAETFDVFIAALEEQATALADKELAAERGDDAALAEIDTVVSTAQADAEAAAEDFGFEVCGDPSASADGGGAETDTGAAVAPAPTETAPAPVEPAPAEPAPTVTPEGGATPDAPPADTGGDSDSGGVSP